VTFATDNATFLTSLVSGFFLNLFIVVVVTYYLLVDGRRVRQWLLRFDDETVLRGNLLNVIVTAFIAIAVFQGYNAVAPAAAEVPYPTLAGALTGVASLIPAVGMKIVYIPLTGIAAIPVLTGGDQSLLVYVAGLFVLALVVVDTIPDLVLRPLFSGEATHVGLLMLAYTLGPVVLGFYGLFFAPIVLVVGLTFADTALPRLLGAEPEEDGLDHGAVHSRVTPDVSGNRPFGSERKRNLQKRAGRSVDNDGTVRIDRIRAVLHGHRGEQRRRRARPRRLALGAVARRGAVERRNPLRHVAGRVPRRHADPRVRRRGPHPHHLRGDADTARRTGGARMTTRPRPIDIDSSTIPGLAAFALFVVMATVFVTAEFGAPAGFPEGQSVVAGIGNALLGITVEGFVPEGFLVALILMAVVLDAALDGALMLAKRDGGEE
jgi:hypothetical protein